MISKVKISGYQSLRKVELTLGRFTVVAGPTSSGKSSLYRALVLMAKNARGHSYVTRGMSSAVVAADFEGELGDCTLTIERGDGIGSYAVVVGAKEKRFTKLGGEVPEAVQALLKLPFTVGSNDSRVLLGFASQFDRPFLLTDSPAQVARVFGELTGVDLVFRAARESNRLRLQATEKLKDREEQLARVVERARVLARVRVDKVALETAEAQLERVLVLQEQCQELDQLMYGWRAARVGLDQLDSEVPPEVDLSGVDAAADRLRQFRVLVKEVFDVRHQIAGFVEAEATAVAVEQDAANEIVELLEEAGVCPLCGSVIRHEH